MANYCTWCDNHGFKIVYNFQHRRVCKFYQCRCFNCAGTGVRLAAAAKQRENERKQNAMQAGKNNNNKSQKFPANQNNNNINNHNNQKFPAKKNNNANEKNNGKKNVGRPQSSFSQHSNDKPYCRFCQNHGHSFFNIGRHYSLCKYRSCPCRKCEEFRRPKKASNKSKDRDNKRSNPSDGDSSAPGPSKRPRAESSDQVWPNCPLCINHGFKFPLKPHHVSVCLHKSCQCDPCRKERKCEKDNDDSKGDDSEENVAVDPNPPESAASSEAPKLSAVVTPESVESEKNVPVAPKPRMVAPPTEVKRPCAVVAPKPRKSFSTEGENIVTDHAKESTDPVEPGPSGSQKSSEKNEERPSPAEQQENIQAPQTESWEEVTVTEDTPNKAAEDTSEQAEESEMSSSQETTSSVFSETVGVPELLDDEYKTVSEASDSSNDAVPFHKLNSKRRVLVPETSNEASDSTKTNVFNGPMDKSILKNKTSDNKSNEELKDDISSQVSESVTEESSVAAKNVCEEALEVAKNFTEESLEAAKEASEEAPETAESVTEESSETTKKVSEERSETAEYITDESSKAAKNAESNEELKDDISSQVSGSVTEESSVAAKNVCEEASEVADNVTEESLDAAKEASEEPSETAESVCEEPSEAAKKVPEVPSNANKNALIESLVTTLNFPEELLSGVAKNVGEESLDAAKIVSEESLEAAKKVPGELLMAEEVSEESAKAVKQVPEESPQLTTYLPEEFSKEASGSTEETSKESKKISNANQNIVSVESPSSVPIPLEGGGSHIISGSQGTFSEPVPLPVANKRSGVSDLRETVKSNDSKGKQDEDKTPVNDKDPVKIPSKKKSTDMADLMAQLASLGSNLQKSLPCNRYANVSRFPRSENPLFEAAPVKRNSVDLSTLLGRSQPDSCRTPVQETTCPLVKEPQASEPARGEASSPTPAKVSARKVLEKGTLILKSVLSTNEEVSNDGSLASAQNPVEGASGNVSSPQGNILEDTTSEDSIENLCEICSKSFRGWTNFRVHQYLKHKVDSGSTPGTKYRCRKCSYQGDTEMATLVHEESHMPLVPLDRMLLLFCAINDAHRSKNVQD